MNAEQKAMVEAFEEYFKADSQDPAMSNDLKCWQAAWEAARALEQREGPEFFDGCERDGFIGGCARMGCHRSIREAASRLCLAVCTAAANGAIDPDHRDTDEVVAAGLELTESLNAQQPEGREAVDKDFFVVPEGLDPRTTNLVARFATALAEKLAQAERKYGYRDDWAWPSWMDECRRKLVEHVAKGDPRDVAAYCAFLWHHGEKTAMPQPTPPAKVPEGYVLVPVEPNSAMVAAAHDVDTGHGSWPRNAYRAMLAAAPKPEGSGHG